MRRGIRWLLLLALPALLVAGLMVYVPGDPGVHMPPLSRTETEIRANLERHVQVLAGDIGERNVWRSGSLELAAGYIRDVFESLGYAVTEQPYRVETVEVKNLEAGRRGVSRPEEILVIGAHYDTVPGSPGANDNASGVAALLEIARLLADAELRRSVRFVAFVNEELPFFLTEEMGSRVYARRAAARGERIVGMLSIETIGYYSDVPGSQHYPFPFQYFYPDTANFIGFVSNFASRRLLRHSLRAFRGAVRFPSEGVIAPARVPGVAWSDHWSFWQEGWPAIMVTDTALYRYPYYHDEGDVPARIDYDRTARVTAGLAAVVRSLAGRR